MRVPFGSRSRPAARPAARAVVRAPAMMARAREEPRPAWSAPGSAIATARARRRPAARSRMPAARIGVRPTAGAAEGRAGGIGAGRPSTGREGGPGGEGGEGGVT